MEASAFTLKKWIGLDIEREVLGFVDITLLDKIVCMDQGFS